jgi:hypothetical protein
MLKIKFLLLFLCLNVVCFAQNSITIKGKIIDEVSKLPLESATIYVSSVKDSTIIDYIISDKNGNFSLSTKKITKPVFFKIGFLGMILVILTTPTFLMDLKKISICGMPV